MTDVLHFMSQLGPCLFYIHDCPQKCEVTRIIKSMSGVVISDLKCEYVIPLAAPNFDAGTNEVFCIDYIQECRRRNMICGLVKFRLNKITLFSQQFEPLTVLMRMSTWSRARREYGVTRDAIMLPALQNLCEGEKSQEPTKKPLDQAKPTKKDLIFNIDWSAKNLPAIPFPKEVNAANNSVQSTCAIAQAASDSKDQTAELVSPNKGARPSSPEAVAGPSGLCRRDSPSPPATNRVLNPTTNSMAKKFWKDILQPNNFYKKHNLSNINVQKFPSKTLSQEDMVTKEDESILGLTSVLTPVSVNPITSPSQPSQVKSGETNHQPLARGTLPGFLSALGTSSLRNVSKRKPKSNSGSKRREYTQYDKKMILDHVMDENGYSKVKGVAFWKDMEKNKVLPGRTWQSLKEHFLKQILPNIEKYEVSACALKEFKKISRQN